MKRLYWIISVVLVLILSGWAFHKDFFPSIQADSPPSIIELTLLDFTIESNEGEDIVVIPDCVFTSEVDKPYLPVILKSYPYSQGFAIQNVSLEIKDQVKEGTGIRIPNYQFEADREQKGDMIPFKEASEWYPEEEFEWEIDENPDGTKNLLLTVYPFSYNHQTTEYRYFQHFKFTVDFIPTYLQIKSFEPEKDVYDSEETVVFSANFQYQDTQVIQALANLYITDINNQVVDSLPMVDLADIEAEENKANFEWKNEKRLIGHYQAVLEIRDYDSKLLDFKRTSIQIGRPMVKVHDFSVVPAFIKPGDTVQVNLIIQNVGKIPIDGLLLLKIQGDDEVKRFEKKLTALQPGVYISIEESWKTIELQKGQRYTCIATAYYFDEASESKVVTLSTNTPPFARIDVSTREAESGEMIQFNASASTDSDGQITEYHWIFGDNMESDEKVATHKFNVAGSYQVKLVVIDNAGDIAETIQSIQIHPKSEEPPEEKIIIKLYIGNKTYYVNGIAKEMDTAPIILEGRTLLPIRYVAEALGASVGWEATEQKAIIDFKGIHIELWIGKNSAKVNNEYKLIDSNNPDVKPIIVPPGRTMLPIRFIAETLGCQVDWAQATQEVTITYPK